MAEPRATRILVWMCVFIAVNQLGFGAIVPVVALYAARSAAMSTYRMLSDLGYVVGPIALGVVTDVFGPDAALATAAALMVAVAALFARGAPETYRSRA